MMETFLWIVGGLFAAFVASWFVKIIQHMVASIRRQKELLAEHPTMTVEMAREVADAEVAEKMCGTPEGRKLSR